MPGMFGSLDTGMPDLSGMDTDKKVQAIQDYLVQMLEQLRYTLHNLGGENFNDVDTAKWVADTVKDLDVHTVKTETLTAGQINADGKAELFDEGQSCGEIKGEYYELNQHTYKNIDIETHGVGWCRLYLGENKFEVDWSNGLEPGVSDANFMMIADKSGYGIFSSNTESGHSFQIYGSLIQGDTSFIYDDAALTLKPDTIEISRTKNGVTTTYDLFDKLGQI